MRQQYHSRWINGDRYVWDVYKLIERVKNIPIIDVPLTDINEINENYWYDCPDGPKPITRDIALHAKLIYECDLSYPIILDANGRIMDGMHRCCKALIEGHETIKAVRFKTDPEPDYINPDWDKLPYDDDFKGL